MHVPTLNVLFLQVLLSQTIPLDIIVRMILRRFLDLAHSKFIQT